MFSKASPSGSPMSATGARNTPFSLIGSDVVIRGDMSASVDLHIDGRIEGDLACAGLVQGPESVIRGNVTAKTARIAGTVEGSITAEELIVERTARIAGDANYGTLSIESGARVDGRFASKEGAIASAPDLKLVGAD